MRDIEIETLKSQSDSLRQKEEYYIKLANDKVQTDKQLRDLRERDASFQQNKNLEIMKSLQTETEKSYKQIESTRRQTDQVVKQLKSSHEQEMKLMNQKHGVEVYHKNEQAK